MHKSSPVGAPAGLLLYHGGCFWLQMPLLSATLPVKKWLRNVRRRF